MKEPQHIRQCSVCRKAIDMEGKYAVLWDLPYVSFAHLDCAEQLKLAEEIAAEIEAEEKM